MMKEQTPMTRVDDLKEKYSEASQAQTPKKLKISKVKQVASMFNMKISQIAKRDIKYSAFENEFSPEARPLPMPRHYNSNQTAKSEVNQISNCFVDDDILDKLTVKDKAQLYSQYIKNIYKISPKKTKEGEFNKVTPPIPAPRNKYQICPKSYTVINERTNLDVPTITPPIPAPRKMENKAVCGSSSFSSAQHSEVEESESGWSSLPKTTSDESHSESVEKDVSSFEKDFDFAKPLKPLRKKKLRRNSPWIEINPVISTDSESDCKRSETKIKTKNQDVSQHSKSMVADMDQTPVRLVQSPRKIKLSYSHSINNMDLSKNELSDNITQVKHTTETDCLTDQGFETESNETDRLKSSLKSLSLNLQKEDTSEKHYISIGDVEKSDRNNFGFSTPIRAEFHQSFSCTNSAKQQLFSPIDKPIKNRRRSLYDTESRRSSLPMQVICEDQPLEHHNDKSASIYTHNNEHKCLAKASHGSGSHKEKLSKFWIKCGDFAVALDIFYTTAERLQLLYEIFSQTSCDTKDLHFGIDNHKFSVHNSDDIGNVSTRLPDVMGSSHYWFSTGDLAIPFSGKYLSSQKIQRLFQFVKASVEETGILVFGVDDIEFSKVPEFWHEEPKFSMESNYSMLVGLQSGYSNGLEGRSKYAWPRSKSVKVTDLDETSFKGEEDFEVIESGRLSYSPFGSNHYDLSALNTDDLSMPRNSDAMLNLESYCYGYENDSLDKLFENNFSQNSNYESTHVRSISVPEVLKTMKNQQDHLRLVQKGLSGYTEPVYPAEQNLEIINGTPEYLSKLKSIVTGINNLVSSNNLKQCSIKHLESYMFFLSRYANICLNDCHDHMNNILEALNDYRAVMV